MAAQYGPATLQLVGAAVQPVSSRSSIHAYGCEPLRHLEDPGHHTSKHVTHNSRCTSNLLEGQPSMFDEYSYGCSSEAPGSAVLQPQAPQAKPDIAQNLPAATLCALTCSPVSRDDISDHQAVSPCPTAALFTAERHQQRQRPQPAHPSSCLPVNQQGRHQLRTQGVH